MESPPPTSSAVRPSVSRGAHAAAVLGGAGAPVQTVAVHRAVGPPEALGTDTVAVDPCVNTKQHESTSHSTPQRDRRRDLLLLVLFLQRIQTRTIFHIWV